VGKNPTGKIDGALVVYLSLVGKATRMQHVCGKRNAMRV